MIKAIFYSKFDTQEGPKVVHQVPDGAIVPTPTAQGQPPFLTFSDISFFVIPRQELCGNLIQVCANGYRILGYPICMKSPRYDRNEFIFNFCLVLAEEEDFSTYKGVVQKLADLMRGLEEQSLFLSRDHSKGGEGKVYSLCETLMEDLNNYCECMIPIDDLNTLNIKLFPIYPAPPPVKAWQVPLFTVRYQAFMDENWDLTMQRIVPYINGVNSIRIISILGDADFSLTCRAIRHLLYYGCLFLLDIFSFSAIYAPTALFSSTIASDEAMQQECARYVNTLFAPLSSPTTAAPPLSPTTPAPATLQRFDPREVWPPIGSDDSTTDADNEEREVVDGVNIVELYASLKQGQSVKQWYMQHSRELAYIDIRRFITFGIIKGFLYRVHKYAYATGLPAPVTKSSQSASGSRPNTRSSSRVRTAPSTAGGIANTPSTSSSIIDDEPISVSVSGKERSSLPSEDEDEEEEEFVDDKTLGKFLDGLHCFDQICTELEVSERDLTARLKKFPGEVLIIHR